MESGTQVQVTESPKLIWTGTVQASLPGYGPNDLWFAIEPSDCMVHTRRNSSYKERKQNLVMIPNTGYLVEVI